ncbi:MAG TPA: phosphodiester glycosidase family protein [Chthoniobacterales bacterium]|nr:phosphodiester glycosidase family protein [Chthoniobacterales bacterium]
MPRALNAAAALLLLLCGDARAEWTVVSSGQQGAGRAGVVHLEATTTDSESGARATLHLAVFSPKSATLRVIDDAEARPTLAETMQRENAVAGVNGGYFEPDYAPLGLLISDGRTVAPLRKARLLSGILSAAGGRVYIQRVAEYSAKAKPTAARQCGPFLVDRGVPVPGLNATRAARRTFVATAGADRATIGYSSHLTLAQIADVLATPGLIPGAKVERALNLDGGSSSGFWFAGNGAPFSIREQKTVRDFIAVVPR